MRLGRRGSVQERVRVIVSLESLGQSFEIRRQRRREGHFFAGDRVLEAQFRRMQRLSAEAIDDGARGSSGSRRDLVAYPGP